MWKGRNIIWAYLSSTLFWATGMVAAYLLVTKFCSHSPKLLEANILKVDSPVKVMPTFPITLVSGQAGTKKTSADANNDIFNLQPQVGRRLPLNYPPPIAATQALKNAEGLSHDYFVEKINSKTIWFLVLAALNVLIVAFWIKKDSVLDAREKDKDPDEVKSLFKEFELRIDLLRNPRKELRFLNLVKYHYYFLTKNEMANMENLRKMMWVLLEIQDDRDFVSIEGINREELSTSNWFYNRIQNKPWYKQSGINEGDNKLLMIILKLNVDLGS